MSVEILQVMVRNFYILSGVLGSIMLILFFRFQIWKIVGDLSGMNAKREICAISKQKRGIENLSQGIFGMKPIQEEKTEAFAHAEDTELWEEELLNGTYCLIEKTEYRKSAE